MQSIFSRIIQGEIPCYKIKENDNFLAFLDVFPLRRGHVLVVPKQQVDKIYELSDELLAEILVFAKPIAQAIEKGFPCLRCGMSVVGIEVPHAHLHLVPIQSTQDLNFTQPKLTLEKEELLAIQETILSLLPPS